MSSTTPPSATRFLVASDDCTTVIDTLFTTGVSNMTSLAETGAPRLSKVLCRTLDEADAAFVAKACSAYEQLVVALRACLAADGISERRAASAMARIALAAAEA